MKFDVNIDFDRLTTLRDSDGGRTVEYGAEFIKHLQCLKNIVSGKSPDSEAYNEPVFVRAQSSEGGRSAERESASDLSNAVYDILRDFEGRKGVQSARELAISFLDELENFIGLNPISLSEAEDATRTFLREHPLETEKKLRFISKTR